MKTAYRLLIIAPIIVAFVVLGQIAPAHADKTNCLIAGATFTINYYQDAAHTMPWTAYQTDGNTCGSQSSPVVDVGQTIYFQITVTGASPDGQVVWYQVPGYTAQDICTIASGGCSGPGSEMITSLP